MRVAGPLGWLIPSEICPLEVRSTGQSLNVAVNFLFSFVIGQAFLSMLCVFQYGIFFFFAGWVAVMTAYAYFFIPEVSRVHFPPSTFRLVSGSGTYGHARGMQTKDLAIETIMTTLDQHWFWRRYAPIRVGPEATKDDA